MRPIHPFMALAGAAVVLVAGYAWGAAAGGDSANPFMNTQVLATSGARFVEGPEADPPPWPANAPKAPPLAMNSLPSSALSPISQPPADPTTSFVPLAPTPQPSPAGDEMRSPRPRPRRIIQKEVTFGATHEGRPVTIIWNN